MDMGGDETVAFGAGEETMMERVDVRRDREIGGGEGEDVMRGVDVGGDRGGEMDGGEDMSGVEKESGEGEMEKESTDEKETEIGALEKENDSGEGAVGNTVCFGVRLEALQPFHGVHEDGENGEEPQRKRRRMDVEEYLSETVFDPNRHCYHQASSGRSGSGCRDPQKHSKLCDKHALEKFRSQTPKFGKFATLDSLLRHMVRVGMYRYTKLGAGELDGVGKNFDIPWVDTRQDRCGEEFTEEAVSIVKLLLERNIGAETKFISFTSRSTMVIDVHSVIRQEVIVDEEVFVKVYRLFCVCMARATDTAKNLSRKGEVRINSCKLTLVLSDQAMARYSGQVGGDGPSLLSLYGAESFSDCIICFHTPLQGAWEYEEMGSPVAVSDCVVSLKSVVPDFLVDSLPRNCCYDGRLRDSHLRVKLKKECASILQRPSHIGRKWDSILPGQSVLHKSTAVYAFSPSNLVEEERTGTATRRLLRTVSQSSCSQQSLPVRGYDVARHVAFFAKNVNDCHISLLCTCAPVNIPCNGVRIDSASMARLLYGYLSKEWYDVRKRFIELSYDFDRSSVSTEMYKDYLQNIAENESWSTTVVNSGFGRLLLQSEKM